MHKTLQQEHICTVGELVTSNEQIIPQTRVHQVAEKFFASPHLDAIALVEQEEPIGLVTRTKLLYTLSRRFGLELYRKHPIIAIANSSPLIVSEHEPLTRVIDSALERRPEDVYDEIIVTDGECRFRGLLPVKQLVIHQSSVLADHSHQKEISTKRAQDLERINLLKSQFVTHVTHELRSPLIALIRFAELLKVANEKGNHEQVQRRLAFVLTSAITLRALVTNILDLSKIEAGKMVVVNEQFDIRNLLSEITETARILVGNKPIEVELAAPACPFIITSDPVKIRQILMNLVSNAAKFTERGNILIAVIAFDKRLEFSVSDTGPGIKQKDLDRLFSPFEQLDHANSMTYEGTGLGLAICKNLVEMLCGTINIASTFGKGSTFTVSIPYQSAHRQGDFYGAE